MTPTTVTPQESGMRFGPWPEEHCFLVEASGINTKLGRGVKIAEFLLLRRPRDPHHPAEVWVIEAKTTAPRPENHGDFRSFIEEISEKLSNTLHLGLSLCLGWHGEISTLPEPFKKLDWRHTSFKLVLVINGLPRAGLPDLRDALNRSLRLLRLTTHLPPVAVWNAEQAKSLKLVQSFEPPTPWVAG